MHFPFKFILLRSVCCSIFLGVAVSFTTPTVVVNEDVPEEETEVCFEGNTSSARPYQVMLLVAPSGQDPATG